jgi:hypothetical protein
MICCHFKSICNRISLSLHPPRAAIYPPATSILGGGILLLIVYYVGFMIAGDLSDYLIGLIVEREFGSQASLIVFLALYFLFLWLSWLFAVWMTEPKPAPAAWR